MLRRLLKKLDHRTRRYLRLPASWPVKIRLRSGPGTRHVAATKNVSAGGIAVVLQKMFPVGTDLHIEIYVPPLDHTIRAEGEVVRCVTLRGGHFESGIHFLEIHPKDRAALTKAVEKFQRS